MSKCKECGACKHEKTTELPTFGNASLAKCDDCGEIVKANYSTKPYPVTGDYTLESIERKDNHEQS